MNKHPQQNCEDAAELTEGRQYTLANREPSVIGQHKIGLDKAAGPDETGRIRDKVPDDGQQCGYPECSSHVTTPCPGCGRVARRIPCAHCGCQIVRANEIPDIIHCRKHAAADALYEACLEAEDCFSAIHAGGYIKGTGPMARQQKQAWRKVAEAMALVGNEIAAKQAAAIALAEPAEEEAKICHGKDCTNLAIPGLCEDGKPYPVCEECLTKLQTALQADEETKA